MLVEKLSTSGKKRLFITALVGLLLALGFLLYLPANYFDSGQSICLSVLLFDQSCYGCGLTRAVQHLIHFEFIKAIEYNKLVIFVFPLLIGLILNELIKLYKIAFLKK